MNKKGSKFPDLTGDGKVSQADILKGRGVKLYGGGMATKGGAKGGAGGDANGRRRPREAAGEGGGDATYDATHGEAPVRG